MTLSTSKTLKVMSLSAALLATSALTAVSGGHGDKVKIGETTALVAEASTPGDGFEIVDGQSADTDFPFLSGMKALATVGEVDAETGMALTGWPDGNAAWLIDEDTVRIAYQSESYATMSTETYPWEMASGVTFTGSHIHTLDYSREGLANFLQNDDAASTILEGSGHLFNRIYNVFGDEVQPRSEGGVWGNQVRPDGEYVQFAPGFVLEKADFFFQSFCGSYYEPASKYGDGIGVVDNMWLNAEEWNIQRMFNITNEDGDVVSKVWDTNNGMGLASIVVDIANSTAYTVPALGQTGYEKIMPINPQHPDYVVMVLAGYNHGYEPAPLKIYVGLKGAGVDGEPLAEGANERDQFLARNGLLHGKIYGVAAAMDTFADLGIDEPSLNDKMMDAYMGDPDAANEFPVAFAPTSYQWGGWDKPVAVGATEMFKWSEEDEQPEGHMFLVGDSKTEHPAVDPDFTKTRWVQSMSQDGGYLSFDMPNLGAELAAANGKLPAVLSGKAVRTLPNFDGSFTVEVANKGIKHGGMGTHATDENDMAKANAPDGLMWIKGSDADVLIADEDSGNAFGERKYAIVLDDETLELAEPGRGYFLAMAGGTESPRAKAGATALAGALDKPRTSEFSGTWDLTAMLTRKEDGSFYTMEEIASTGENEINQSIPVNEHMLLGVVQHRTKSGGQVAEVNADRGGQVFMFQLNLPEEATNFSMLMLDQ
ncbi:MAG: calcium-binding protein [Pseudomonadota bacterium]